MEADYATIVQVVSVSILAASMLYLLLSLIRKAVDIRNDVRVDALRIEAFKHKVQDLALRAQQTAEKKAHAWVGTRKFRIDEICHEAADIRSFYLIPHDGKELPSYDPGQYLTFKLSVPGQERPVVRCYSLSDSPLDRQRYRVTIKRIGPPEKDPQAPPGISSDYFHSQLNEGDILDCRAPAGNFYLDMAEHSPVVLIGGGIGITPVLSMLRSIALSGSKRKTWLFYGVRDKSELVQAEALRQFDDDHENIHVRFCFSSPSADDIAGVDFDHAEWVSVDLLSRVLPSTNFDYYICGPAAMMKSLTQGLAEIGVPDSRIHYESFGAASVKPNQAGLDSGADENVKYAVTFAKSGEKLDWTPSCGSLLEFAEANDIALDCGCRAGNCGTCAVAVREGDFAYIDEIGAEPERGSCLACMAVPAADLVIDA